MVLSLLVVPDMTTSSFNKQQRQWYEKACEKIDAERLKQLVFNLTDIHSPTGKEKQVSQYLVDYLDAANFKSHYQAVSETSGNCVGRITGSGEGAKLLLYAPIDTHLDGEADIDVPWVGPHLRDDMLPKAQIRGDTVIGLGASNPKSMIASLSEAARCVLEADIPLKGDVIVGSAGGGMPWVSEERNHTGISSGVMHMLSHGVTADMGVIFKPWCEVYYEHPGMVWFKVTVWGTMGYAGIPRGTPGFESSIVPAARLILELEEWLGEYPERHTSTQIKPEGWIAAVRSGWPDKPAFPGAACEIYIDIRTNPDQKMAEVEAEFSEAMRNILAKYNDIKADWEMTVSCQGSRTNPEHWIVQSATRSWEEINQKEYPGAALMSGQTDAATICQLGLPLVRIGNPYIGEKEMPEEFSEGLGGMGVAFIPDLIDPIKQIIYIIIDSCTRSREELNL
jgi:acetylornithine deacetylase/succinyl-diaminopimelate desuccinylase-like protein